MSKSVTQNGMLTGMMVSCDAIVSYAIEREIHAPGRGLRRGIRELENVIQDAKSRKRSRREQRLIEHAQSCLASLRRRARQCQG